jgi:hypothetical protein
MRPLRQRYGGGGGAPSGAARVALNRKREAELSAAMLRASLASPSLQELIALSVNRFDILCSDENGARQLAKRVVDFNALELLEAGPLI